MFAIIFILALLQGYLLGSMNASLAVGKSIGVDIREYGSGNAGLTNTYRVLGGKIALIVMIGDILKAVLAAYIGECMLGTITTIPRMGILVGGLGAILGHNFPIYFNFKGGKGVLVTGTLIALVNMKLAIILFGTFLLIVVAVRFISLASLGCAFILPISVYVLEKGRESMYFFVWSIIVSLLVFIRHRKNIKRLRDGEEPIFTLSKIKRRRQ